MSAVISDCGLFRYRLDRQVQEAGFVVAYFGVNGSTADTEKNDQTTKKWHGFTKRIGGTRYIAGNVFGFRSTDVRALARAADHVGPMNARYLTEIIAEADLLVPCWGNKSKVLPALHHRIDALERRLRASGKPLRIFGLTRSGCPKHPRMLGYSTPLVEWGAK